MKTGVFLLYQCNEFEKAHCFLTTVSCQLKNDTQIYLLINDNECSKIRSASISLSPYINIYCLGKNVGVAGGRNFLIQKAIENGVEFLISCDTDIIFETNYFEGIRAAYSCLSMVDQNIGLLQPVLFNGPDVAKCFPSLSAARNWHSLHHSIKKDEKLKLPFWSVISKCMGGKKAVKSVLHCGIINVWDTHFGSKIDSHISSPSESDVFKENFVTGHATLKSEPKIFEEALKSGTCVKISSTAGGISAFHKTFFLKTGGYDEIFNPFGFEDSEFGFRASALGFNHYLVTTCAGIHVIFFSGQNRTTEYISKIGLLRGVAAGLAELNESQRLFATRQSIFFGLTQLVRVFSKASQANPEKLYQLVKSFPGVVVSYFFEYFRGLIHSSRKNAVESLKSIAMLSYADINEINDFDFLIDDDIFIAIRKIIKKGLFPSSGGKFFSFHGSDCHIRKGRGENSLQSRFFDINAQLIQLDEKNIHIHCDILSHDILFKINAHIEIDILNSHRKGAISMCSFNVYSKKHNYGDFSKKDLRFVPTIYKSTKWIRSLSNRLNSLNNIDKKFSFDLLSARLLQYLDLHSNDTGALYPFTNPILGNENTVPIKKRILIFTDSRGQHKPIGSTHATFTERLANIADLDVDFFVCPMKWTTTLDFLQYFNGARLAQYDHVILYTGIVEWSPRRAQSALNDLYDNQTTANEENLSLNSRDYSKKIVNNKKSIFDRVFGEGAMREHLSRPLETIYDGQHTINMYGLDMARDKLLPILAKIPNLIFITANRFAPDWEGDYKRGRPANISITEQNSDLFATELANAGIPLIDLREWSLDDVKIYTCDNIHLTEHGSNYIYERLVKIIDSELMAKSTNVNFNVAAVPEDICMMPLETRILSPEAFSLANKFYRDRKYAHALQIYEALAARESLGIYRENAKMAKAKLHKSLFRK